MVLKYIRQLLADHDERLQREAALIELLEEAHERERLVGERGQAVVKVPLDRAARELAAVRGTLTRVRRILDGEEQD